MTNFKICEKLESMITLHNPIKKNCHRKSNMIKFLKQEDIHNKSTVILNSTMNLKKQKKRLIRLYKTKRTTITLSRTEA